MQEQTYNAKWYEQKYQEGYGVIYPESHIIRVHKHILEWELHLTSGKIIDFGCGSGANLQYFDCCGFIPCGCDTSANAIDQCKKKMPKYANNFFVTPPVKPDLCNFVEGKGFDVFLSNQVLYYMSDDDIKHIVHQAHALLKPGGVFVATMMSYSCWYARYIVGEVGDFKQVAISTPRINETTFINCKNKEELPNLFLPFRSLHIGSYGSHIREEEGSTDHWIFIGCRD